MPKIICKHVNCNKLVDKKDKYCEEHLKLHEKKVRESLNFYRRNRTDEWEQSFYKSKRWLTRKHDIEIRDFGLCRLCLLDRLIVNSDLVHHIEELKADRSKALDDDNLICLCDSCHKRVHIKYRSIEKIKVQKMLKELALVPPYPQGKTTCLLCPGRTLEEIIFPL